MLKKSKKLTALLVAAASICSIVPVSVSAAERLGTKEGTLETAISFKDGKYIYKGYQDDEDDNAIYYNDGKDEKQLKDVEDADIQFKYGNKYAYATDSDDEYFVDLTNGKVEDDEELADKLQNIRLKLKTALKKTDRYGKAVTINPDEGFSILPSNNFSDIWYSYSAAIGSDAKGKDESDVNGELYGFTDGDAKYIDIAHTANMYVYSSKRGKMVKVEKFNDEDTDAKVIIHPSGKPEFLAQDYNYIYVKTVVWVEDTDHDSDVGNPWAWYSSKTYIQKISKAQGDKEDDAYLPKSVESYEVSDLYDNDDACDAADIFGENIVPLAFDENDGYSSNDIKWVVKGGVLYAIQTNSDDDKIRVTKFKMKKDKVNINNDVNEYINIDSKLDVQLLEKDDDEEQDIVKGGKSVSIDVDGNIWVLDKGSIVKFDDLEPKELYRCDNSLTNLDVYDSNNLIAWEENGDSYTVLQAGNKALDYDAEQPEKQPEQTNEPAVELKSGWEKNSDGTWSYYKDNVMVKGQWVQDGNWYYLKEDGIMARGWLQDGGSWYYLDQSGAMLTGWLEDTDGSWYYLSPETGAMLTSTTVDGYVLGADGIWIK